VRHFYLKALIEKSAGEHADWKAMDAAEMQAASAGGAVAVCLLTTCWRSS
jgi:hypothetical protein